ncbi:von Willebrand factor type A [Acetobacter oeni LMG 21952]|nr:von Willebrand factor type A [Acetobacter oeni LMG 21952]
MSGSRIQALNEGLKLFQQELQSDPLATQRVEIATVTFGPARLEQNFVSAQRYIAPHLTTGGNTPLGDAVLLALQTLEQRKVDYREAGIGYYRPWVFLVTDGSPTDSWHAAARAIHAGDNTASKSFSFFAVGVEGADMQTLSAICSPARPPVPLKGLSFREMFSWLSSSLSGVAHSQVGAAVPLSAPMGWTEV